MSKYIAHQESLGEFTLEIHSEDYAENPYTEYECLSDVVTWLRSHEFSSEKKYDSPEEVIEAYKAGEIAWYAPLMAYIHGGITVRLYNYGSWPDQQWDCGLAGMVYVTTEKAKKEFLNYANRTLWLACRRVAEREVTTLDDWLTGNVWGWQVKNGVEDVIDSCGLYYGDYRKSGCLEDGRYSLRHNYTITPLQLPLPTMEELEHV